MTSQRRRVNIYDYPEHLNPFYEGDKHNIMKFKNLRKIVRSNSFSFQSVRDLKNSITQSFRVKNRRDSRTSNHSREYTNSDISKIESNKPRQLTSDQSTELGIRNEERIRNGDYKVTNLPGTQHVSNHTVHDANSTNEPIPPSRTNTLPRRKKRAPPPPPLTSSTPTISSEESQPSSISGSCSDITHQHNIETSSQDEVITDKIEEKPDITVENKEHEEEISSTSITGSKISLASNEILNKTDDDDDDDDAADLLQMVQQLQKEVEKLTGDTNNNMLEPNCEHSN